MLKKRILSGLAGMFLTLILIYLGGIWYSAAVFILAVMALEEYYRFSLRGSYYFPRYLSFTAAALYFLLLHINLSFALEMSLLLLFIPFCLYFLFNNNFNFRDLTFSIWGIIYIAWFLGFLTVIRFMPEGFNYTLLLFLSIWVSDTAAFFIGSYLGKHKLKPSISPNKTIEGSLGGLFATVLFVTLLRNYFNLEFYSALGAGIIISFFGQAGDLVESALKRHLKLKDSGGIIPGHGGILDRFDSILLAAPPYYFYIKFLIEGL